MKAGLALIATLLVGGAAPAADEPCCRTHRAATGETWASLAQDWLGRASYGPILAELNGAPPEKVLRKGDRVVVPVVVRHKLGAKETLSAVAARYYGDPKKARILRAFGRFPNGKAPAPGTVIGIPITASAPKPPKPAPEPTPAPPVVAAAPEPSPPPSFVEPLRAAEVDYVYGDYERALQVLEEIRIPVRSSGSVADQRELSRLLAFTYVALDRGAQACEAYSSAPPPRVELDPDLVSPKIRQALAGCLDSPPPAPQIPSHGDEQAGRKL